MGKIEPEKEIKKVVICYEDGEEKEIEKGFFCEMHPEEECLNLTFHMFRVEGKELVCIIEGMMELGGRLGMFSPAKEIQEGEELKELIENLEEGQILEVTFDAE